MSDNEQDYIRRIQKNDESALTEIYDTFFDSFIKYFKKYGLNLHEIEDAFQDTIIALFQNIVKGNLKTLEGSIKTYIWGIGKHKVVDIIRKNTKKDFEIPKDNIEPFEIAESTLTQNQLLLQKHFKSLGDSCQKILKYFYYEGLTIQEIQLISEYKDENTVKSTKSRCIKQLRNLIKKA